MILAFLGLSLGGVETAVCKMHGVRCGLQKVVASACNISLYQCTIPIAAGRRVSRFRRGAEAGVPGSIIGTVYRLPLH